MSAKRSTAAKSVRGRRPRRPRFSARVVASALEVARRLTRRGVLHVAWGMMEQGGRSVGKPGVIVFVGAKRPAQDVSARALLPKRIGVKVGGRTVQVPIDVQVVPRGAKHLGTARAGDRTRITRPDKHATLSALFDGPNGLAAAISGHAATVGDVFEATLGNGATIALGEVAVRFDNPTVDAARIDEIAETAKPFLSLPYSELRDLTANDVGEVLTLRLVDRDVAVAIAGVEMPADFGTITMVGLVKLDHLASTFGDSGAPALDYKARLVGFVVGAAGDRTYLIPARKVFDALS